MNVNGGSGIRNTYSGCLQRQCKEGAEFKRDGSRGDTSGGKFDANDSTNQREVLRYIRHYTLKVLSLVLVGLLKAYEGSLGRVAGNGG